jgi:asparagine synthase (glutamine-hydrolysing)
MCGICGTVGEAAFQDPGPMRSMVSELMHRGPNSSGELVTNHAALGATRLAILDIEGGGQPMYDCAGSTALVINGEIYNYCELRLMLERHGHAFRTQSDGEVVVHLYEEFGTDFVTRLRGMFALALWDPCQRLLVLARDRMGEKPLHFHLGRHLGQHRITFASELRALIASRAFPVELDPTATHEYFHYQYVPEPQTPLTGVAKLPAGHVMTIQVPDWRVELSQYWSMVEAQPLDGDPVEAIEAELLSLSPLVTRADVPIGVALSGGLDSSTVAALAARSSPTTVHAFSLGYQGRPDQDERIQARELADVLDLKFHEVELGDRDIVATFFPLVRAWNEPIADLAGFSYLAIADIARRHGVPVLLQGQGGDELFWGYPWVRRAMAESMRQVRSEPAGSCQLAFYDLDPDFQEASHHCQRLYGEDWLRRVDLQAPSARFTVPEWPDHLGVEITRLISQTYLQENGIAQGDRVTMSASVELRLPLVDHRLVETTIGFRKRIDDHKLEPKAWLREAAARLLPETVIRRPKRPFSPPLHRWHAALLDAYGWMLPDGMLVGMGVLRRDAAARLATAAFPPEGGSPLSFKALVLEAWCRTMLGEGDGVRDRRTKSDEAGVP